MGIVEVQGIVTREVKYGDNSRIITILTKDFGKVSVLAGGVRSNKSGLLSATQLFSYASFTLFKGREKSLYKINGAELITPFSAIRDSLEKMAYASYFCDIANYIVQEESPDEEMVSLLLNTLYVLSEDKLNYEQIKGTFEFRILSVFGMLPDLAQCRLCKATENISYISPAEGCAFCEDCGKQKEGITIHTGSGIINAIYYIASVDAKKIFSFSLSDNGLKYLSRLGEYCIECYLEKKFKTLEYLKKVTALG